MKKYIIGFLLLAAVLITPASSYAASLTQAQIQSILTILSSFGVDSATVANIAATLNGNTSSDGSGFCYKPNTDLTIGSSGSDVSALNTALATSGIDTTGLTTVFDENTAAAVVLFQAKYGIRQTGYVGPMTRAKLTALYGCGTTANPPVPAIKVALGASTSGPWTVNGSLPNSGTMYLQTTNLVKANNPKGCASPAGSTGCLNPSAYRNFTSSEWVDATTVRTIITGGQFPNGSYDAYILYPNGQPTKVGTITLTDPGTNTPAYYWSCATFGGPVAQPSVACTASNVGTTVNATNGSCTCTAKSVVSTPPSTASVQVSLGASTSGPWTVNGSLPNSGTVYVQTTSLVKASSPKGCMSPAGSTGCLVASAYRDFTAAEWTNDTTVTTVVQGGQFPNGSYDGYIMYPNGQPTKVGTVTLTAPNPACFVTGAGQTCSYKWSCASFGGTVTQPSTACSASNVNTTVNVTNGSCTCSYTVDASTPPPPSSPSTASVQVSLGASTSGPWTVNGSLPNSGTLYFRTTGLVKASSPKGCASPAGSTGCLVASAFRDFTAAEWTNDTTVTTVATGGQFPNGSYDSYILYPNGQPTKVGTVTLTAPAQPIQVSMGTSTSGPWTVNGSLPNTGTIYVQTTGLVSGAKGCASPAGSTGCLVASAFRDFTSAEWVNSTTVRTVITGGQFPNGSYDSYILYPNGQPTKVGTMTLTDPAPATPACFVTGAGQTCTYHWTCATFGGTVQQPATACTASNVGTTVNATNGSCTCSYSVALNPTTSTIALGPTQTAVLGAATACVDLPYNMFRGYESYAVTQLQDFLKGKGLLDASTGFYGDKTVEAVKAYQFSKDLPQTGMVYDFTRGAIKAETCQ